MTVMRVGAGLLLSMCLASAQFGWFHRKRSPEKKEPVPQAGVVGMVIKGGADSFVIRAEDARIITFKIGDSAEFFRGSRWASAKSLRPGAMVAVQSTADPDGIMTAREVDFLNTLPPMKAPEDVAAMLPGGVKNDALVRKAREASGELFNMLPNFLCQQSTLRSYAGADHQWRTVDKVSAEVLSVNGHETYRDVRLNGRPTGHTMMELPGSRSTGEFSSTLRALFEQETGALFRFNSDVDLKGFSTAVYDFAVSGKHSDWRISAGSQMILTPYAGKVWIDRESGNVVRIEMKAVDIPRQFPFQRVDAQVDYGPVDLPSGRYFLPEQAENVSCNDPKSCSRNVIEFRNYHKYVGESSISFDAPEKP